VTELSPFGRPLEHFMFCPAQAIPSEFGVVPLGQRIVGEEGEQMVLDWIGESNYPNCMDFWEEVRVMGASRHITQDTALRLRPGARLFPIHPRAIIRNWLDYPGRYMGECPKCKTKHQIDRVHGILDREMPWFPKEYPYANTQQYPYTGCTGYWQEDITGGKPYEEDDEDHDERMVRRILPWGVYGGLSSPSEFVGKYYLKPDYEPGIMGWLPINRIHVINGADTSEERYEILKANARESGGFAPIMMEE
jgi:hypothetical protein